MGRLGAMLVAEHHAYDPERFIAERDRRAAEEDDTTVREEWQVAIR